MQFQIQPGTNEPLPFKRFLELMALIIFNQAVVGMLFSVFTYHCYMWKFDYNETILKEQTTHKLPDFTRVFLELLFFVLVEELGFFYSHYALHSSRFLYKNIHKRHHEWQVKFAVHVPQFFVYHKKIVSFSRLQWPMLPSMPIRLSMS